MRIGPGMLAKSKAGRDKDCIYVIICVNDDYVYLADGKKWTVCHLKKKNRKHVQPICRSCCETVTDDERILKAVEEFANKQDGKV